jgi:dUTPase
MNKMTGFESNNTTQNQTQSQLLNLNPSKLLDTYDKYMYLKLYIDDTNYLKQKYIDAALNHNNKILNPTNLYLDAGFDLFNPKRRIFNMNQMNSVNKFDHNIVCSAQMITDSNKTYNTGYYMHPRSSVSKTKLRLANATGIIDSGYRGHLMGMFDLINLSENEEYVVEEYDRLLQICAPGLAPIVVEIVDTIDELGNQTERGVGGFGSTGR